MAAAKPISGGDGICCWVVGRNVVGMRAATTIVIIVAATIFANDLVGIGNIMQWQQQRIDAHSSADDRRVCVSVRRILLVAEWPNGYVGGGRLSQSMCVHNDMSLLVLGRIIHSLTQRIVVGRRRR